jgi:hypothetical protein
VGGGPRRRRRWPRRSCPAARSDATPWRRRRSGGTVWKRWVHAVEEPQAQQVSRRELVVLDRLLADQGPRSAVLSRCMSPPADPPANQASWSLPAPTMVDGRTP